MVRSVLYFRDGSPCDSDIEPEVLEAMYKIVMRGQAEIRVRTEYKGRSLLFDLQYLDPFRTFPHKERKTG